MSAAGKEMTGIVNGAWIVIHEATELEAKGMAVVNETVGLVVQGGTGGIMTGTTEIENIKAREEKITTEIAVETIDDLKDVMKGASLRLETRSQDTRTLKITVITDNKSAGMILRGFQKSLRKLELHPQFRPHLSMLVHPLLKRDRTLIQMPFLKKGRPWMLPTPMKRV